MATGGSFLKRFMERRNLGREAPTGPIAKVIRDDEVEDRARQPEPVGRSVTRRSMLR